MLSVHHLTKFYGTHCANDNVSIEVHKGRIFGLLGPNGAGKTTLIRMITGITLPDSGTITLDGLDSADVRRSRIGYLPEERGLYKKLTVAAQLRYFAGLKGLSAAAADAKISYWLDRMDASGWEGKKIEELSKGMQQKVQFISTILHEPSVLILDEPFSGLDPVNADLLIAVTRELQQAGTTIILSTHQMDQVERLCDDIALINRGRVVLAGEVSEVRSRYESDRIRIRTLGPVSDLSAIPGTQVVEQSGSTIVLRRDPGTSVRDVLGHASQAADIVEFAVLQPSLHEIFVRTVTTSEPAAA
ncbi:MAG: ATP-binding cassette domain-containing protein [Candidatus Kapabacteria bacterium]|nr:ATP-binding cassette domain-containing protein [Candidatus Kapabacteria bacterium]